MRTRNIRVEIKHSGNKPVVEGRNFYIPHHDGGGIHDWSVHNYEVWRCDEKDDHSFLDQNILKLFEFVVKIIAGYENIKLQYN